QVYLDLLGSWREAWELASAARQDAAAFLAQGQGGLGGREVPPGAGGSGGSPPRTSTVTIINGLARTRDGMARVTIGVDRDGIRWLELRDDAGRLVPALAEGVRRRDDG